jgi:hypothetical protein
VNVGILKTHTPFLRDATDEAAAALAHAILDLGHDAEVIRIPFRSNPIEGVLGHLLAMRLLKLPTVDGVIAFGFPAFCIEHPVKVTWLIGEPVFDFPDTPEGRMIQEVVAAARELHLSKSRRVFGPDDPPDAVIEGLVA